MANVEDMFKVSIEQEMCDVSYYHHIAHHRSDLLHKVPWGGAIIRNCSPSGELLNFRIARDFEVFHKETNMDLWLLLSLKVFRHDGSLYGVYCCPQCNSMAGTEQLSIDQDPQNILPRLCMHSRVASTILDDWRTIWDVEINDDDRVARIICNEEIKLHTFLKQRVDQCLLAAVRTSDKIAVLYTVTTRQTTPICSACVTKKCPHYYYHKKNSKKERPQFQSSVAGHPEEQCDCDDDDSVHEGEDTDVGVNKKHDNYWDSLPEREHQKMYGYNFKEIPFPIKDDKTFQSKYLQRLQGNHNFPDKLIPEFVPESKCKIHGNEYDPSEDNLHKESNTIIIYSEVGEKMLNIPLYSRPTAGDCSCTAKFDGTDLLIWNLGQGRFVDFTLLFSYLHKWVVSGIKMYAFWKSIKSSAAFSGVSCTITYNDIHRSICGFFNNLGIDYKKAFSCPVHGNSPHWLVSDGKNVGPLKRRVDHLKELDINETDKTILIQSTKFKDRCFLSEKKERINVLKLLNEEISPLDFLEISEMNSENGRLIIEIVRHIAINFPEEIPTCYKSFLANVARPTSVRGFIQVISPEPLEYLEEYCKEVLDIRSHASQHQLNVVQSSLPALWPDLDEMCNLDKTVFLPKAVSRVILRLLKIRQDTFLQATPRTNADYVSWPNPEEEHPTQAYPNLPIFRFPSNYRVSSQTDVDICDKAFIEHNAFAAGIYSIGCGCDQNITLGFELMLRNEGPKNLFRILQCRDIDMDSLQGILVDHACLVDPYILNREAEMLQWKLLLVDGAHWNGMKKLRKPDRSGKNGHIGCSDGFNFNLYKPHLKTKPNSQGREQMHSLIAKCTDSLRLMNYRHFMIFMKVFFAVKNLEKWNGI